MTYPVLPRVWTLDGMVFNDGVVNRYLTDVTGWAGRPPQRMNKTPKVGGSGAWLGGHYNEPRTVEFKGCWRPVDRADGIAAVDALSALCSSGDALTQYVLRVTEGTRDRWTWCVLDDELDPQTSRGGLITFDSQLFCPDSRWWSAAQQVWAPTLFQSDVDGGLLWNGGTGTSGDGVLWNGGLGTTGGGVEWQQAASVAGGSVVVQNLGNDYTSVVFTMTGTGGTGLTNPYVRLESTGDVVQYSGVIAVGDSVTVDTGTGRVLRGLTYVSGALLRSEMFELPPNSTSTITFGSTGASDQGLLTGYHYHAYQGG